LENLVLLILLRLSKDLDHSALEWSKQRINISFAIRQLQMN